MTNKKEFLLRKNKGRLELSIYLSALEKAGLRVNELDILPLEESENYLAEMKAIGHKQSSKKFNKNEDLQDCLKYINSLLYESNLANIWFWTKQSEYCGLISLKVNMLDAQTIINILNDEYFGGYCTLLSTKLKVNFDLDEDYDDDGRYSWLYSVSVLSL